MFKIPRRYNHFVFSVIQSGLTCFIAAGIASLSFVAQGSFVDHWMKAWVVAWVTMLPVVLLAAPVIRKMADRLTHDDLR